MRILSIAYPFAPVRPDTAGGAEQVLAMVERAVCEAGHESIVIAARGSEASGRVIEIPAVEGTIDEDERQRVYDAVKMQTARVMEESKIDMVHMHGVDFYNYMPAGKPKVLVTLHLPIAWYEREQLEISRHGLFFNCVSSSQFETAPANDSIIGYIENGVTIPEIPAMVKKENYAVSLGRICPEKGFHIALDAARMAGIGLTIAGQLYKYPAYERYYLKQFSPRLDGKKYKFIGAVGPEKKIELLSRARCILIPSLAAETSSLVAIEAIACGTAVIAFQAGALPEIVEEGKTGFIVQDVFEMAEAVNKCDSIDPQYCRMRARERFGRERMCREYLELYKNILEVRINSNETARAR
jgi:glycosyltransferase involved in cell wall biosynthesis